ncbi:hypothetical protein MANI_029131 [Metarhizium anisopliae]|nr:hypothetical protein MANI_029131 [Metarhizium anisopliae]
MPPVQRRVNPQLSVMKTSEETNIKASGPSATGYRRLANPNALGFGAFATTLLALSLSATGFRGVSNQSVFIGNLCFLAGIGLLISAQWEMARGNTFGYTVLSAFGLYYGGYGVLVMPSMGILESYQGQTSEYYNAFGIYQLG